jgi:uncharacterized protein YjbI with pentapeptide repeats
MKTYKKRKYRRRRRTGGNDITAVYPQGTTPIPRRNPFLGLFSRRNRIQPEGESIAQWKAINAFPKLQMSLGRKRFKRVNLNNILFRDSSSRRRDLSETLFIHSELKGAKFDGANLKNTSFHCSDLTEANFTGATNAEGIRFSGTTLKKVIGLTKDIVEKANSDLHETKFIGLDLQNFDFKDKQLYNTDFTNSNLTNATFKRAILMNVNFTNSNLVNADFSESIMKLLTNTNIIHSKYYKDKCIHPKNQIFDHADVVKQNEGTRNMFQSANRNMTKIKLNGTQQAKVDLTGFSFAGKELTNADFSYTNLTEVNFNGSNFRQAIFKCARFKKTKNMPKDMFQHASTEMQETEFNSLDLTGFNFKDKFLSHAKFIDSILTGAKFKNARLANAEFTNVTITSASGMFDYADRNMTHIHFLGNPSSPLNLSGANFLLKELSNAWFKNCDLHGVNFNRASLFHVDFTESKKMQPDIFKAAAVNMRNTVFKHTRLTGIDFSGKQLNEATFKNATLIDVNFSGSTLAGADFTYAKLLKSPSDKTTISHTESLTREPTISTDIFKEADRNMAEIVFTDMDLTNIDLSNKNLSKAKFSYATLKGVNFSGSILAGADFSYATLKGVNFSGSILAGADFTDAKIMDSNIFKEADRNMAEIVFTDMDLTNIDLSNKNLSKAKFSYATLKGVNFSGSILAGADFTDAKKMDSTIFKEADRNMQGIVFKYANLTDIDLSNKNLSNANFADANLTKTIFTDATITTQTNGNITFDNTIAINGTVVNSLEEFNSHIPNLDNLPAILRKLNAQEIPTVDNTYNLSIDTLKTTEVYDTISQDTGFVYTMLTDTQSINIVFYLTDNTKRFILTNVYNLTKFCGTDRFLVDNTYMNLRDPKMDGLLYLSQIKTILQNPTHYKLIILEKNKNKVVINSKPVSVYTMCRLEWEKLPKESSPKKSLSKESSPKKSLSK